MKGLAVRSRETRVCEREEGLGSVKGLAVRSRETRVCEREGGLGSVKGRRD